MCRDVCQPIPVPRPAASAAGLMCFFWVPASKASPWRDLQENPILIPLEATLLFPVEQHFCQIIIGKRNKIV